MAHTAQPSIFLAPQPLPAAQTMATQSPWEFLTRKISSSGSSKLVAIGVLSMLVAVVTIGCEGAILSKIGKPEAVASVLVPYQYGSYLFVLSFITLLLSQQPVYTLISIFIFGFYELINLIQIIVNYSVVLYLWDQECRGSVSSSCGFSTVRTLIIACLLSALASFGLTMCSMIIIAKECRPWPNNSSQRPVMAVSYTNPTSIPPSY